MFNPLFLSGSKSTDFDFRATDEHPLPPCPYSPNCVRISKAIPQKTEVYWEKVIAALERMGATEIKSNRSEFRIDAVFRVFFFKDDFSLKLQTKDAETIMHIRSASREGYSDLGVNRRRVKRFLKLV